MSKDNVKGILKKNGYDFLAEAVDDNIYIDEKASSPEEIFGLPDYVLKTLNNSLLKGVLKTWRDKQFVEKYFKQYNITSVISPSQFLYLSGMYFYEDLGIEFNQELFDFLTDFSEKVPVLCYNDFFQKKQCLKDYYKGPDIPNPKEVQKILYFFNFVENIRANEMYTELKFNQYMSEMNLDFSKDGFIARRVSGFREYCQVASQVPYFWGTAADILKCIMDFSVDLAIITKGSSEPYMLFLYYDDEIMVFEKLQGVMNLEDYYIIEALYLERGYDYASLIAYFNEMIERGETKFHQDLIDYINSKRGDN